MENQTGFILFVVTVLGLSCTVQCLTGENVCKERRTVPVMSLYSSDEIQTECENLGFTVLVCQQSRAGRISIGDLFIVTSVDVCCDGWLQSGDSCSTQCPDGRYGPNCTLSCQCYHDGPCDHVTGVCSCPAGWKGARCEERCSANEYGPNCSLPCQETCLNGAVCHPSRGHCLCDHGWQGPTCNSACVGRSCSLESDSCSNGARYDPAGVICVCASGWWGRYCTESCPDNKYGQFCPETCGCQNGSWCNPQDGSCVCQPGFTGPNCDEPCPVGFYGQGCALKCDCPQAGSCNSVDGACIDCPLGFTGHRCTENCQDYTWGPSCRNTCNCGDGAICDIFTGQCGALSEVIQEPTTSSPVMMSTLQSSGPGFDPSRPIFLAPLLVAVILLIIIVILTVVAIKKPCNVKPADADNPKHTYAATIAGSGECGEGDYAEYAEYAEIGEIACTNSTGVIKPSNNYNKPQPTNGHVRPPNKTVNTPPIGGYTNTAARFSVGSLDQDGYLELTGGQSQPPAYQAINTPQNI